MNSPEINENDSVIKVSSFLKKTANIGYYYLILRQDFGLKYNQTGHFKPTNQILFYRRKSLTLKPIIIGLNALLQNTILTSIISALAKKIRRYEYS